MVGLSERPQITIDLGHKGKSILATEAGGGNECGCTSVYIFPQQLSWAGYRGMRVHLNVIKYVKILGNLWFHCLTLISLFLLLFSFLFQTKGSQVISRKGKL